MAETLTKRIPGEQLPDVASGVVDAGPSTETMAALEAAFNESGEFGDASPESRVVTPVVEVIGATALATEVWLPPKAEDIISTTPLKPSPDSLPTVSPIIEAATTTTEAESTSPEPVLVKTVAQQAAEKLASSGLSQRLNTRAEAKSEREDRKSTAEKQTQAIKNRVEEAKSELQVAKDARSKVKSRTNFANRYLDRSQLRSEIVREANRLENGKSFQKLRQVKNSAKSFKVAREIIDSKADEDRRKADAKVDEVRQVVRDAKNSKRNLRGSTYGGSSLSYGTVRSEVIGSRVFDTLNDEDKKAHYEARRKALMTKRNSEQAKKQAEARRKMINDAKSRGQVHTGKRV